MSSTDLNSNPPLEIEVVVIDLEEYFEARKPHPEHHPHRIFHYRVRVNDEYFKLQEKQVNCEVLLSLVGKSPEKDQLLQLVRDGEGIGEIEIGPEETVDLSRHHTKKFETREKIYCFFIGKKEYRTHREELSVRQILVEFADVSPETKTLAQKRGSAIHEYKDLKEEISLKDCPHFTLFDNTPTGLS